MGIREKSSVQQNQNVVKVYIEKLFKIKLELLKYGRKYIGKLNIYWLPLNNEWLLP